MFNIMIFSFPYYGHTKCLLHIAEYLVKQSHNVFFDISDEYKVQDFVGLQFLDCRFTSFKQASKKVELEDLYAIYYFADGILTCNNEYLDHIEDYRKLQLDLIIYDSFAFWGKQIALQLDIPYISSVTTQPLLKESFLKDSNTIFEGYTSDKSEIQQLNLNTLRMCEKAIRKKYSLDSSFTLVDLLCSKGMRNIVYINREFCSYEENLDESYHFIGPLIKKVGGALEKKQVNQKIIYISFGTIMVKKELLSICIDALKDRDFQIYVSAGSAAELLSEKYKQFGHIHVAETVCQLDILEKADLFITHAGQNSIMESLYFSVPMLMIPLANDAFINARWVEKEKLGFFLKEREASIKTVGEAVTSLYSNEVILNRVQAVSMKMKAAMPYNTIHKLVEELLHKKKSESTKESV
ncbi:glycosyltransferase [Paenibacillus sp. IHBB 10380]|uniref:glycosyltransferase n=1 Tax=Paenibacillus sp. IHBB 10380 TaxID=1566358 RepID=UPI0005CF9FFE|nr:glycosyltransferase [Paenibacillus sp. IHBB 10380]AJS57209.1 hypothetical protein UB51_00360 [Paenibacillus sp. IHBB 10380]